MILKILPTPPTLRVRFLRFYFYIRAEFESAGGFFAVSREVNEMKSGVALDPQQHPHRMELMLLLFYRPLICREDGGIRREMK